MTIHLRWALLLLILGLLCAAGVAQDEVKPKPKQISYRFGFNLDVIVYPQQSPKDAMTSIVTAINRNKIDYMLAHLTDPHYVDYWVDRYKGDYNQGRDQARIVLAFERLERDTRQYLADDPLIVKDLRSFAKDAEWAENEDVAVGVVKAIPSRKIFMRRIQGRWFMENRQQDEPAQK